MAPETVSDTVKVVVWKWAEDVALTVPVNASNSDFSIYGVTTPKTKTEIAFNEIPIETMAKMKYVRQVNFQINIGNKADGNVITFFDSTAIPQTTMQACEQASGERLVSLRPLLRAFRDWRVVKAKSVILDAQEESEHIDYLSFLSYMYRFFRGGMRYKIISDDPSEIKSYIHPGIKRSTTQAPSHRTYPSINPFHEISIPYYTQYRKLPISVQDNLLNVTVETTSDKEINMTILRSGNDDLTFGWLMGTPQLMAGQETVEWQTYTRVGQENPPSDIKGMWEWLHPAATAGTCGTFTAPPPANPPVAPGYNVMMNPYAAVPGRQRRDIAEGIDIPDNWQPRKEHRFHVGNDDPDTHQGGGDVIP